MHSNLEKRAASPASRASADNQGKGVSKPAVPAFNPVQKVASKEEEPVQGKFTPVVQREIIAEGEEDAGRLEAADRGTLEHFLTRKIGGQGRADPEAFTADSYAYIERAHASLLKADLKLSESSVRKDKRKRGVAQKAILKGYTDLVGYISKNELKKGNPVWDAAISLGAEQYASSTAKTNTETQYKQIAQQLWPTLNGRTPGMLDSFWKALKTACKLAHSAAGRAAYTTFSAECENIYAHMLAMFAAWDGTRTNRGAWWSDATAPGNPAGSRNVKADIIHELRDRVSSDWIFSNSDSGGISFKRVREGAEAPFIYHMLAS